MPPRSTSQSSQASLDDLLRPALRPSDNAGGLEPGYNPRSLYIGGFFGGPFFAAFYFARNARLFGTRPSPIEIWSLAALVVAVLAFFSYGVPEEPERLVRLGSRFASLAFVYALAQSQDRAFSLSIRGDREPRPLGLVGFGVFVGSFVATAALVLCLWYLANAFGLPSIWGAEARWPSFFERSNG